MRYIRSDNPHDQIRVFPGPSDKLLMPSEVMTCRTSAANDEDARVSSSTITFAGAHRPGEALHWITAEWPADELRYSLYANEILFSH